MLFKLVVLILSLAALSASMLAVRQERLVAVGQMAEAIRRSERAERDTWRLRLEIARAMAPQRIASDAERVLGPLEPIMLDTAGEWCPPELLYADSPATGGAGL